MDQLNELVIAIKLAHHTSPTSDEERAQIEQARFRHPLPSIDELNALHIKINQVLSEDSEPYIKY